MPNTTVRGAASTSTGVPAAPRLVKDTDVLEDHRLRRSRLGTAFGRGTAAPGSLPGARHLVVGLTLAVLTVGGTAAVGVIREDMTAAGDSNGVTTSRPTPDAADGGTLAGDGGAAVSTGGQRGVSGGERRDTTTAVPGTSTGAPVIPAGPPAFSWGRPYRGSQ